VTFWVLRLPTKNDVNILTLRHLHERKITDRRSVSEVLMMVITISRTMNCISQNVPRYTLMVLSFPVSVPGAPDLDGRADAKHTRAQNREYTCELQPCELDENVKRRLYLFRELLSSSQLYRRYSKSSYEQSRQANRRTGLLYLNAHTRTLCTHLAAHDMVQGVIGGPSFTHTYIYIYIYIYILPQRRSA